MLMKSNMSAIHLFCVWLVFPFSFFLCPIFVLLGIESGVLGMADNVPYHWSRNYLVPAIDNSNFKKLLLPLFCQLRSAVNPWNAVFFWVNVLLWRYMLVWLRDVLLILGIWTLDPQLASLFKWHSLQKEVSHWVGVGFEIQSPVPLPVRALSHAHAYRWGWALSASCLLQASCLLPCFLAMANSSPALVVLFDYSNRKVTLRIYECRCTS